jgi:secondary thiamine-phosphate synthase enzyme
MTMQQAQHTLTVTVPRQGMFEITTEIEAWLGGQTVEDGLLTLFIRHTSASLVIQENADDDVQRDMETFFTEAVPEDISRYRHTSEGSDDMPAHIKGALTQTQISIPVAGGLMMLGTWQGIFLFEHRRVPRNREIALHLIGE